MSYRFIFIAHIKTLKMNPNDETTVNITLKLKNHILVDFENWLKDNYNLISFAHLQNTDNMYQDDKAFKKVLKQYKDIKKLKDEYIIKNNYRYNE